MGTVPAQAAPVSELEGSGVTISVQIATWPAVAQDLPETGFAPLIGAVAGTLALGAGLTIYVSVRRRRRVAE